MAWLAEDGVGAVGAAALAPTASCESVHVYIEIDPHADLSHIMLPPAPLA